MGVVVWRLQVGSRDSRRDSAARSCCSGPKRQSKVEMTAVARDQAEARFYAARRKLLGWQIKKQKREKRITVALHEVMILVASSCRRDPTHRRGQCREAQQRVEQLPGNLRHTLLLIRNLSQHEPGSCRSQDDGEVGLSTIPLL